MNPITRLSNTVRRYAHTISNQRLIDKQLTRLDLMERQITIKNAIAGNPDGVELAELSKLEQLKLLKGILIEKVRLGVSAEETMEAIRLLEDKVPYRYDEKRIIEYKIPILSEVGAILSWGAVAIAATGIYTLVRIDPNICKPSEGYVNQSQFCQKAESFSKFFYNYQDK